MFSNPKVKDLILAKWWKWNTKHPYNLLSLKSWWQYSGASLVCLYYEQKWYQQNTRSQLFQHASSLIKEVILTTLKLGRFSHCLHLKDWTITKHQVFKNHWLQWDPREKQYIHKLLIDLNQKVVTVFCSNGFLSAIAALQKLYR